MKYLVNVVQLNAKIDTFAELRYMQYITKKKLSDLPPTSFAIQGHLLRPHFFVNLRLNLLEPLKRVLSPLNYGWMQLNRMFVPEKYQTHAR